MAGLWAITGSGNHCVCVANKTNLVRLKVCGDKAVVFNVKLAEILTNQHVLSTGVGGGCETRKTPAVKQHIRTRKQD